MLTKRSLITLLVGCNLLLLIVLMIGSYSMPSAFAQAANRQGDFIGVTAKAQGQAFDVLYLLDSGDHKLYALHPTNLQTKQYAAVHPRDLKKDFAG